MEERTDTEIVDSIIYNADRLNFALGIGSEICSTGCIRGELESIEKKLRSLSDAAMEALR